MPVAEAAERLVIRMTLEEMKALDTELLTSDQVASFLRMDKGRLTEYGRKGMLPFPHTISGNRLKIPRLGFINWAEGKPQEPAPDPIEKLIEELHAQTVAQNVQNAMLMALLMEMAPNIRDRVQEIITKTGGAVQ